MMHTETLVKHALHEGLAITLCINKASGTDVISGGGDGGVGWCGGWVGGGDGGGGGGVGWGGGCTISCMDVVV